MNIVYKIVVACIVFLFLIYRYSSYRTEITLTDTINDFVYYEFLPHEQDYRSAEDIFAYPEEGKPYRLLIYDLDEQMIPVWYSKLPEEWKIGKLNKIELLVLIDHTLDTIQEIKTKKNRKIVRKQHMYICYVISWADNKEIMKTFSVKGAEPAAIDEKMKNTDTNLILTGYPVTLEDFIDQLDIYVQGAPVYIDEQNENITVSQENNSATNADESVESDEKLEKNAKRSDESLSDVKNNEKQIYVQDKNDVSDQWNNIDSNTTDNTQYTNETTDQLDDFTEEDTAEIIDDENSEVTEDYEDEETRIQKLIEQYDADDDDDEELHLF